MIMHRRLYLGQKKNRHSRVQGCSFAVYLATLLVCRRPGVAKWLRRCATIRTVPGSIPGGVTGFFSDIFLPTGPCHWDRLSL